jgi:hypothetical protein
MLVGEGAKRRMKFEIVEVHNFTSHDFVYFKKNSTSPHTSD